MDKTQRPIRFGYLGGMADRAALVESARSAEKFGFSTFALADHLTIMPLAPLVALQAVADATTTLGLSTAVLNQDLRHPAVLAKDLATLDVLSGGRLEVGIGAGWMKAEYDQAGIGFDAPSVRIERLEEVVTILKGLFADETFSFSGKHFTIEDLDGTPKPVQRPHPPIVIGGGGPKLLAAAGRCADIVGIATTNSGGVAHFDASQLGREAYAEKVGWVRDGAGDRFDDIELNTGLMGVAVTTDRKAAAGALRAGLEEALGIQLDLSEDDIMESPAFALGTVDQICEQVLDTRERFGINYFMVGVGLEDLAPVIEQLNGK